MIDTVEKALKWAENKHGNQKYGEAPYIYHLSNVVNLCKDFGLPIEYQVVAALHDVLEDTNTTWLEVDAEFGTWVAVTVNCLTKKPNETYGEYILRVSKNLDAKAVKVCDLLSNLEHCILDDKRSLVNRYQKALFILSVDGRTKSNGQ